MKAPFIPKYHQMNSPIEGLGGWALIRHPERSSRVRSHLAQPRHPEASYSEA